MTIRADLTAIHRRNTSIPLRAIKDEIGQANSVLEYGCGHGYDLLYLRNKGFDITGYDKFIKTYSNENYKENRYNIIYCFYVLNVVADEDERKEILLDIKELLKEDGVFYIAVRSYEEFKRFKGKYIDYKDGIITSRNTFQKYFKEEDLVNLIKESIGECDIKTVKTNKNTILLKVRP